MKMYRIEVQLNCKRLITALLLVFSVGSSTIYANEIGINKPKFIAAQTDVDRAEHHVDENGIPYLLINDVGYQRHPAWVAIYALAYAGNETYDPKLANLESKQKFEACIDWLENNLVKKSNGLWVWDYKFNSTYNDISIKAPWSSAFAQATGIQAFVEMYKKTGNVRYLNLANNAAKSLFTPIDKGGFLFESGSDIWFEEIPVPKNNPSHILNGHMRVLIALKELAEVTNDKIIWGWIKRGSDTLYNYLPKYDTGYWLRYDLNPRKNDLLFRFANPYGYKLHHLSISKISLINTKTNERSIINVGKKGDFDGTNRLSGVDWDLPESSNGKSYRKLLAQNRDGNPNQFDTPHTYFNLSLPGKWLDNLSESSYIIEIEYFDDEPSNITIQQRSISPGIFFRDMRDGDLMLEGSKTWKKWNIPLRTTDLGYWVGDSYAEKHYEYLKNLSEYDYRFNEWKTIAYGYLNSSKNSYESAKEVEVAIDDLPLQTPPLPVYSLDDSGVARQHFPDKGTKLTDRHMYDPSGSEGTPIYSPYVIASQLLNGQGFGGAIENNAPYSKINAKDVNRLPALLWLLDDANHKSIDNAWVFYYNFNNTYNNVITLAPWQSAFGQAFVLKSLVYADAMKMDPRTKEAIKKTANAYKLDISKGGVTTTTKEMHKIYEEVPNGTHVLNGHLVSIVELKKVAAYLGNNEYSKLSKDGVDSFISKGYLYDTGYWMKYDMNPKPELLLQFDWLEGSVSPLISDIKLIDPQTLKFTKIDVGSDAAFQGNSRISGKEWGESLIVDNFRARNFLNGYVLNRIESNNKHNVFFRIKLPELVKQSYFSLPVYKLVIKYKDVAIGKFNIKIQDINNDKSLGFIPLRNAIINTDGDGEWKEAVINVRSQDLGWYKGSFYQTFEIEQLDSLSHDNWYIKQYAQKQRYNIKTFTEGTSVIRTDAFNSVYRAPKLSIINQSTTYKDHSYKVAFDNTELNNYVAGIEGEKNSFVLVKFENEFAPRVIELNWESERNYANNIAVFGSNDCESFYEIEFSKKLFTSRTILTLTNSPKYNYLKIEFSDFTGQNRLLLRRIGIN